jgi:hypothetical protein
MISLIAGGLALAALMLLIDRLERIAQASPIAADHAWSAPAGTELRLEGLPEGPVLGVETSPGGGLTVTAPRASSKNGGPEQRLLWISQGKGDNKTEVEVALVGANGSVSFSRSGEAETPQLRLRVDHAKLLVQAGVTIGDSLVAPAIRTIVGQEEIPSNGLASSFVVPAGGTMSIELPAFPDGTPSGVVTWLGAVTPDEEDAVLPLREAAIAREGIAAPDKAACGTNTKNAWPLLFRPTLFPVPTLSDCKPGAISARGFAISRDSVAVSLSGYAWQLEGGVPTASIWSWANSNPVLSLIINKLLPSAVGAILAIFTWWRRTGARSRRKADSEPGPRSKRSRARAAR